MNSLAAAVSMLQLALSLLSAVQATPNAPQSLIDSASQAATQAITQARTALATTASPSELSDNAPGTPVRVPTTPTIVPNPSLSDSAGVIVRYAGIVPPITNAFDLTGSQAASDLLRAIVPGGTTGANTTASSLSDNGGYQAPNTSSGATIRFNSSNLSDGPATQASCRSGSSQISSGSTIRCQTQPAAGVSCLLAPDMGTWLCRDGSWVQQSAPRSALCTNLNDSPTGCN